jgi:hypothetical protein
MQDAALEIVKLLDDTGLPPLYLAALCLVVARQELQRAAQSLNSNGSKIDQVTRELQLREEGVQQISRLRFSTSDQSPLETAQAVLGGLEYILHEDLRVNAPSFEYLTGHLALTRMISQDTGGCQHLQVEERAPKPEITPCDREGGGAV